MVADNDKQLADIVRGAAKELNTAIITAARAGLSIDLDIRERHIDHKGDGVPSIEMRIRKEL